MIEQKNLTTELSVDGMWKYLSWAYVSIINSKKSIKRFPSVMLWGAPGVGKSQGVRQVAKTIEEKTGKKVVMTDVRLLLFNPIDLRGIPTSNAEKTLAIWLKPKIFQMDESENVINILFLDEISAAPPSVQAAAYQITLDRMVGEHKLPDNCIVIAAGNRVTDNSVAYNMPKALANRLLHINVNADFNSWKKWAYSNKIHPLVIGFLEQNPSYLVEDFNDKDSTNSFATPRTWEMVSNILNDVSDDVKVVFPLIKGCVGGACAYPFRSFAEVYSKIPSVKDICDGKTVGLPVRAEAVYATITSLVSYLLENHSDAEISGAISYVRRLKNEEFQLLFLETLTEARNTGLAKALSSNANYNMAMEYFNLE